MFQAADKVILGNLFIQMNAGGAPISNCHNLILIPDNIISKEMKKK